jgi:hypothetical protein
MSWSRVERALERVLVGCVPMFASCVCQPAGTTVGSSTSAVSIGTGGGLRSTNPATSSTAAPGPSSTGAAAWGCKGKPGCAVWQNVYITWYSYNDNSCESEEVHGCNMITDPGLGPKRHLIATAGVGTYDDPSTAAAASTTNPGHVFETSKGVTLSPGTIIYNPDAQHYFIMEDACLECGDEYVCKRSGNNTMGPLPPAGCQVGKNLHVDLWMGPNDAMQPSSLKTCMYRATIGAPYKGTGVVIVNPPDDLPVRPGPLYSGGDGGDGGCFTSRDP